MVRMTTLDETKFRQMSTMYHTPSDYRRSLMELSTKFGGGFYLAYVSATLFSSKHGEFFILQIYSRSPNAYYTLLISRVL